ncbi:hypothetical protein [Ramlibacter sp.]|uniref:hypothetical protein n=1 Tax=Ramlibacter sp. TaxID=1917967 RepID=UPI002D6E02D9|nr:hypothetical protein [Ramlibacter sp.]HYD76997.1 hypothetical protein [Ramlibacter sp.]
MKYTPLLLAALLATGSGAWAQVRDGASEVPGANAKADAAADGRTFGEKVRSAADKVGDATRRAANRVKGESKDMAHDAKTADERHAGKADKRAGERHAKSKRDDTRAMGGPGRSDMDVDADNDQSRRERMDQAYANWKSQQNR